MQLRKRLWADHEPADSSKPTSLPSIPNCPQTHTLLGYISKAHTFNTTRNVETKRCVHKDVAWCAMATPHCCACADKRPKVLGCRYVDSMGVATGVRWQSYCPECKEHWTKQKRLGNDINSPLYVSEEDIILTFKGEHTRAVDIVIPSDITASILKTRMAGLLSCDPAELVLQGNGIELKDSHMFGLGLFLGTNTVIHCRRFEAVAMDCDMMDDVQYIKEEPKYYENSHRKRPRHN